MFHPVEHLDSPPALTIRDRALLIIAVIAAGLMVSLLVFAAHTISERGRAPARVEPAKAQAAPRR